MSNVTPLVAAVPAAPYQLHSIAPAATPAGSEGTWFRYVIVQGANEITGLRPGNHNEVDFAVREMVDRLNERSAGKNTKKLKPAGVKTAPAAMGNG